MALNAQEQWGSTFNHIGDPHHEILAECKERDWLSLYIWHHTDGLKANNAEWISHPKGCFQPGVLAFTREGRVLYRWQSRPGNDNLGGALCRPTAMHVWDNVKDELGKPSDAPDTPLDDAAKLDSKAPPQILFLGMLFANGWFLKPNFFIHKTGKESRFDLMRRMRDAQLRIVLFVAAWIVAFAILPIWIPSVALVGWIALVAPQINTLKKSGQNVAPDEEPIDLS